jgi:hypothetical protein
MGKPATTPESSTLLMPFSTPGDEFLGNHAADDLRLELEARTGFARLQHKLHAANWPEPPVCFLCV